MLIPIIAEDTAGRPIQDFWVNADRVQLVLPFFKSSPLTPTWWVSKHPSLSSFTN